MICFGSHVRNKSCIRTRNVSFLNRSMAGSHHECGMGEMAVREGIVELVQVNLSMHAPSCSPWPDACAG